MAWVSRRIPLLRIGCSFFIAIKCWNCAILASLCSRRGRCKLLLCISDTVSARALLVPEGSCEDSLLTRFEAVILLLVLLSRLPSVISTFASLMGPRCMCVLHVFLILASCSSPHQSPIRAPGEHRLCTLCTLFSIAVADPPASPDPLAQVTTGSHASLFAFRFARESSYSTRLA